MVDLKLVGVNGAASKAPASDKTVVLDSSLTAAEGVGPNLEALPPGSKLGDYLIISKVGEGGMGAVYRAHDTILNRTVALKVLSPVHFRDREWLDRFRIEAQAQARLNGPNVITLHSMFDVPNTLVLVLEFVEGRTLAHRLQQEGRLSIASGIWVFEQALSGLDRVHRMGVVHRDLKPSNIFIANDRQIKLMDFGVAKIMNSEDGLTQTGSIVGTLRYISPEQITGRDADFRSDVYSLGISLFEALTGSVPFKKNTEYEHMEAHLHEAPPSPRALNPAIPKALEAVILKAIEKDPNQRFQTAAEFRTALLTAARKHVRAYRRMRGASPRTSRPPEEKKVPVAVVADRGHRRFTAVTGAATAIAALALGVLLFAPSEQPVPSVSSGEELVPSLANASEATGLAVETAEKTPDTVHGSGDAVGAAPAARVAKQNKYDALRRAWGQ